MSTRVTLLQKKLVQQDYNRSLKEDLEADAITDGRLDEKSFYQCQDIKTLKYILSFLPIWCTASEYKWREKTRHVSVDTSNGHRFF